MYTCYSTMTWLYYLMCKGLLANKNDHCKRWSTNSLPAPPMQWHTCALQKKRGILFLMDFTETNSTSSEPTPSVNGLGNPLSVVSVLVTLLAILAIIIIYCGFKKRRQQSRWMKRLKMTEDKINHLARSVKNLVNLLHEVKNETWQNNNKYHFAFT